MAPKKKAEKKKKSAKPAWMDENLYQLTLNLPKLQEFWCGEVKESKGGKDKEGKSLPEPPNITREQVRDLPRCMHGSRPHHATYLKAPPSWSVILCSSDVFLCPLHWPCIGWALHVGAVVPQYESHKGAAGGVHQARNR